MMPCHKLALRRSTGGGGGKREKSGEIIFWDLMRGKKRRFEILKSKRRMMDQVRMTNGELNRNANAVNER
jgi:hypothetical protein